MSFAVMFYVNSQDASQMEDSFSEIDAQVSIAKAEWAKVYWFKRMALAVERYEARAPAITQLQIVRELDKMLTSGTVPHSLEP